MTFKPKKDDHQKFVTCKGRNEALDEPVIREVVLNVLCKFICHGAYSQITDIVMLYQSSSFFGTGTLELQFTGVTVVQKVKKAVFQDHVGLEFFFYKNCLPLTLQIFTVFGVYAVVVCKL